MATKRELQIAYGMAVILFLVGILSYAAFSQEPPEVPVRQMFHSTAGKIMFDHKGHETGYGINCVDCHHNLEDDEEGDKNCSACHDPNEGDEDLLKRSDAFHSQCIGCHEDESAGPVECNACHVL